MPNWCVNKLTVKGPKQDIQAFFDKAKNSEPVKDVIDALEGEERSLFDFNVFVPYPEHYAKADEAYHKAGGFSQRKVKDGYNNGGYAWCISNWGTKWNASSTKRKGNMLQFETPWSPPMPVLKAASEAFPTLTFRLRWFERGAAQQGDYVFKQGQMTGSDKPYHGNLGG